MGLFKPYFDTDRKIKGYRRFERFCKFLGMAGIPTIEAAWDWASDSRRSDNNPFIIKSEEK
jgi:hypothetical protein